MANPDDSAQAHVAIGLRTSVVRLSRRLRSERQDDSLGLVPLLALVTIMHQEPISPSALAEREGVQRSTLTRIISTLEERGLIAREAHPDDKRRALVRITTTGRDKVADEIKRRHAWLLKAIEELDTEELAKLEAAIPILASLADR